jgi:hypothetical protein
LIIGGVIVSLAIFNGLYPAINTSSSAINDATGKVSDRIESRVEIIQVTNNGSYVYAWIKNVGTSTIDSIERSDIFYGLSTDFSRVTYGGAGTPRWGYSLEGGYSAWDPTVTCKVTITLAGAPSAGSYIFKFVIPNGVYDSTSFSVN